MSTSRSRTGTRAVAGWASGLAAPSASRTSSKSSQSPMRGRGSGWRAGDDGGNGPRAMSSQLHLIEERSQVGSTRRAASELATSLGFSAVDSGKVALAVTEIGTNIVKHAGGGRIVLRALERSGAAGIEILGLDRGPGITNLTASVQDGRSTAGSAGHGLGALARLSPAFDVYTQP